jgi:hypothetical protein
MSDEQSGSNRRPSTLPDAVGQFPYAREVMVIVLGDKIQMVYESHRRLQTRVGNGTRAE